MRASNPDFSIAALVKNVSGEQANDGVNVSALKSIIVDKYGFQSAPGDKVILLLEFTVVCESSAAQQVKATFDDDSPADDHHGSLSQASIP